MLSNWSMVRGFNRSVVLWLLTWALAAFGYFGLQGVLFKSVSPAYAIAIVGEEGRNAVFPVQSAVIALMTFVGSLVAGILPGLVVAWIGGSLTEAAPYHTALWLVPVLFLACVPVLAGARSAQHTETDVGDPHTVAPPIAIFLVLGAIVFLQSAAEGPVRAFFNVYLDRGLGVPPAQIGLITDARDAGVGPVAVPRMEPAFGRLSRSPVRHKNTRPM
jgi:hypothetical protein